MSDECRHRPASHAYQWLRVVKVFLTAVVSALTVLRLLGWL